MSLLHPVRQIDIPSPEVYGYVPKTTLNPISRLLLLNTSEQFDFSVASGRNFNQAAAKAEMPQPLIDMSTTVLSLVQGEALTPNPEVHQPDFTEFQLFFRFGTQPSDDPKRWLKYPVDHRTDVGIVVSGTQLELLVGKAERDKNLGYVGVKGKSRVARLAVIRKGLPILKIRNNTLVRIQPTLDEPFNLEFRFRITRPRSL